MSWKSENEVYEYIGRFNVEFEAFCASVAKLSKQVLAKNGLSNEGMLNALVADKTVMPALEQAHSLIACDIIGHEQVINKVFNRLKKPIEFRNKLIHAEYWIFGLNNLETNEAEVKVITTRHHATKSGGSILQIHISKDEVEQMMYVCYESRLISSLLSRCVMGVRTINDCFQITGKDLVINLDALKPIEMKGT